jgi:ribosome-associated heat shock protein Hsp15
MTETYRVRVDRWLWAARFFKTRAAAKRALEAGRVLCAGQRVKPSREVGPGLELVIERGLSEQTIVITAVAERRGSASDAAQLYVETPASIARRTEAAAQFRARGAPISPESRPDRRDRRELKRMKQFVPERDLP